MSGEAITPGTPLPWNLRDGYYLSIQGSPVSGERYGELVTTMTGTFAKQQGYGRVNAAYIVHACNEYPALKAKADALAEALQTSATAFAILEADPRATAEDKAFYRQAKLEAQKALAAYRESGQ